MLEKIKCPQCGARLIDANKSQFECTIVMKSTGKEQNEPDYQIKCYKCKSLINVYQNKIQARSLAR